MSQHSTINTQQDISGKICWIITESGLKGTENQCIGLAEALGVTPIIKHIGLRNPWKSLSPYFRLGNKYAFDENSDPLEAPWPDIVIASGRKSIAASLYIKKASKGQSFTIQIQDPRIPPKLFDAVILPQHDPTRGENVIVTAGALTRVTQDTLADEKKKFEAALSPLPEPRIAVLIGGNSKTHEMTPTIMGNLAEKLSHIATGHGAGLMITASRRTGEDNQKILQARMKGLDNAYIWDGAGDNPYFAFLAMADYIFVTSDSVSMLSEAATTEKPVYMIDLDGRSQRFGRFYEHLKERGVIRNFDGVLEPWTYPAFNDTQEAAEKIRDMLLKKL